MRRIDRKTISNLNLLLFILLSCFQLQAQELITNGDFETGDLTGWTSSSTGDQILVVNDGTYVSTTSCFDFLNSSNSQPPIAGDHSLLFDMFGPGTNEASTTVTLPSTLANLIFSFDIEYGREENVSAVEIELLDNSSTLIEKIYTSFDNAAETQLPAQYISLNLNNTLASYAGQTINIRISINMGEACIPAQLDNISLKNTVDYAWKNGQDAFRVIGQPNFFSNKIDTVITGGGTGSGTAMRVANSKTLVAPNDIAIDYVNNKMYVSDQSSNRVLRYAYPPDTDQPEAEAVLGQPNFTDNDADELNPTAHNLSNPAGLYVDNLGNLWVADIEYGRVLRFEDAANKANGAAADGVLGKPDFVTASSSPTSASTIGTPWDVFVDKNGTLWVADDSRILRFDDAANKANGAAADGVLGQPNFSTGSSGNNISKFTLSISIFVDDQGTLWVADRNNNRVLRFDDAANKANGADADGVLGQTDFTSDFDGLSGAKFFLPQGITGDAQGNIYITDANNRILIFKNASNDPSVNTASAVLGQPNTGTNLEATTPNGMKVVRGSPGSQQPYFDLKQELLWVADDLNNRVLGFDPKGDGADYFVRQNGNDANDGQSWSTAFATLQKAIESAQAGQSIWVAGGTYYPTKEKDGTTDQSRRFTFFFNKDLRIYGGFNGTESNLCERDIVCNPTILSGDVGVVGVAADNTFHVIESTDLTTDFLLDGFTIQDGYADDDVIIGTRGGAWLNDPLGGTSNPSIYNCTFFNNSGSNGAAMYNDGGSGGETSPIYVNCKFMGNILIDSPARGGAVYIDASFSNGASNARFENCIFSGNGQNTATSDGGAVYISSTSSGNSDIEFTNCSFTNNETTTGGAIFATGFNGTLNIDIKNSILWNNGDEISASNSTVNLSYSIFDDGNVGSLNLPSGITNGGNNSDEDPLFSDADGSDDLMGTLDDDLRPAALSPAYNTGLDSIINTARDIADKLRIIGNSVDRGAHELELVCQPIFVDADATTGNNDGSSWENAYLELNDAVVAASSCDIKVIWVAEGTYLPIDGTLEVRNTAFEFNSETEIYGGFNGTENTLAERDLSAGYETILSGDIGVPDVKTDNAYSVAFVRTGYFIMDGFTITKGFHDQQFSRAGGVTISSPNTPNGTNISRYNITIKNCKFEDNRSNLGGAIFSAEGELTVTQTSLINCTFINNEGEDGGGAVYVNRGGGANTLNIINSSFSNNEHIGTDGDGDVIFTRNFDESNFGSLCVNIDNSIIWNDGTTIFSQTDPNTRTEICISNSILKDDMEDGIVVLPTDVVDGGGNLDANPIFLRSGIGDLRVAKCSPALDVGNNLLTADVDRDLVGSKRIFNSTVDLGAYEWEEEVTSLEVSFLVEADSLVQGVDSIFTSGTVEVIADAVVFEAAEIITLTPGFHAQSGSLFTARIDGCTTENNRQAPEQEVAAPDETTQVEVRNTPVATQLMTTVSELQVQASPNPFTGQTNIRYYLSEGGVANVFITDLNGKVRYQQSTISAQAGWQQLILDANDWNSGMYLLFVRTKDTQVVKQLVVQQ